MKSENYMNLEFPSRSANEAFARSAIACFAAQLVERRVELRGKRRDRGARQPFVDAAARKFNGYVVIRFYFHRSFPPPQAV